MKCPNCNHVSDPALLKCSACGEVYDQAMLETAKAALEVNRAKEAKRLAPKAAQELDRLIA